MATLWLTLDDLNAQFDDWRARVANPRVHATTNRVVDQHFPEERPALIAHPAIPYSAVLNEPWCAIDGVDGSCSRRRDAP